MKKKIFVFDIDGVLLDSSHRYRVKDNGKIDLTHWRRHSVGPLILKDRPLPHLSIYRKAIKNPNAYVVIATARVLGKYDWIQLKNLGLPDKVIHRPKGFEGSGAKMKARFIKQFANLRQFSNAIWHLFEDNPFYLQAMHTAIKGKAKHVVPNYVHSAQGF